MLRNITDGETMFRFPLVGWLLFVGVKVRPESLQIP